MNAVWSGVCTFFLAVCLITGQARISVAQDNDEILIATPSQGGRVGKAQAPEDAVFSTDLYQHQTAHAVVQGDRFLTWGIAVFGSSERRRPATTLTELACGDWSGVLKVQRTYHDREPNPDVVGVWLNEAPLVVAYKDPITKTDVQTSDWSDVVADLHSIHLTSYGCHNDFVSRLEFLATRRIFAFRENQEYPWQYPLAGATQSLSFLMKAEERRRAEVAPEDAHRILPGVLFPDRVRLAPEPDADSFVVVPLSSRTIEHDMRSTRYTVLGHHAPCPTYEWPCDAEERARRFLSSLGWDLEGVEFVDKRRP